MYEHLEGQIIDVSNPDFSGFAPELDGHRFIKHSQNTWVTEPIPSLKEAKESALNRLDVLYQQYRFKATVDLFNNRFSASVDQATFLYLQTQVAGATGQSQVSIDTVDGKVLTGSISQANQLIAAMVDKQSDLLGQRRALYQQVEGAATVEDIPELLR